MAKKHIFRLYKAGKKKIISIHRSIYYKYFFGRRLPLSHAFDKMVEKWEKRYNFGDTTIQATVWDKDYSSGKWEYLDSLDELSRYSVLTGYMASLKPDGAYLDIGCGHGILFHKFRPYGFSSYTGIDISEIAIKKLNDLEVNNTSFICADGENYQTSEKFDVIIFNESIYYFREPMMTIQNYKAFLKKDGIILTSFYKNSCRSFAIHRLMNSSYKVLDETLCKNGKKTWICSVYQPNME